MAVLVHIELCEAILEDLLMQIRPPFQESTLEGLLLAVEALVSYLLDIEVLTRTEFSAGTLLATVSGVLEKTNECVVCLEGIFESYQRETQTCGRGRPKLSITEEQLLHLLQSHFTLCDIAALFGCSVRTIHRGVTEFGLAEALHTVLSDSDLELCPSPPHQWAANACRTSPLTWIACSKTESSGQSIAGRPSRCVSTSQTSSSS